MKHESDLIWSVATLVQRYTGGSIAWTAKQRVSEHQPFDDLYGFVIGHGFASIRVVDAKRANDATIRQLATEIMGYAPDSVEDLEHRKAEAARNILECEESIANTQESLELWRKVFSTVNEKLAVAQTEQGS